MKNAMTVLLLAVTMPALALSNRAAFKLFGVSPMTQIAAQGTDYDGDTGLGVGAEYLGQVSPHLSLGVEIDKLSRSERSSEQILTGAQTKVSGSILAALLMARVDALPGEKFQPYLESGVGFGVVSLRGTGTPLPGFLWSNGGNDTRTLVDSAETAMAFTLRGGLDVALSERLTLGAEAGFIQMSEVSHGLTAQGKALLGDAKITGPESNFLFGASLAYRF